MNRHLYPKYMQNNRQLVQQSLLEALIEIDSQIYIYQQLLEYAPNELAQKYILFLIDENTSNKIDIINKDYPNNFGPVPPYEIRRYEIPNYREGLLVAINNAMSTVKFTRDFARELAMQEDSQYPDIREGFQRGTTSYLTQLNILTLLFDLSFHYLSP